MATRCSEAPVQAGVLEGAEGMSLRKACRSMLQGVFKALGGTRRDVW